MTTAEWIDDHSEELGRVSREIWEHPEASEKEFFACRTLEDLLEKHGFTVDRNPLAGLDTAFKASFGNGRPVIGILAEYDALPGLAQREASCIQPVPGQEFGHGCGHNLLGTAAAGAAIALKNVMERDRIPGTVVLYGCPSEEIMMGKIVMTKAGVFDDLDAAISWHPGDRNRASEESYQAMLSLEYHFSGKASHAAMAPEEGFSALDAVELMDVGVNYLREHVPQGGQMHYVILDGGSKPNIVPDKAAVWQFIRANTGEDVRRIAKRMDDIAEGAAKMTGTTFTRKVLTGCNETLIVPALVETMDDVMKSVPQMWTQEEEQFAREILQNLGMTKESTETRFGSGSWAHPLHSGAQEPTGRTVDILGSSDLSDVSWVVPTCMLFAACYPYGTPNHTWAVTACAGSSIGRKGMIYAAKVMAETGLRLMKDRELREKVKESFKKSAGGRKYVPVQ